MLQEVKWSDDRAYKSGSKSEPIQFYLDGLCHSKQIDLLLGYFSSAAINILSLGFANFLFNGGVLRLVVNNILSEEDKQAVKKGLNKEVIENIIELTNLSELKDVLDEYGKHFFDCIAWLIANNKIQIKIIKPKKGNGISHYKSGVFSDGVDQVGFKASCNFTAYGLLENLEELDAFLSWENSRSSKMINRQNIDFEEIFTGKSNNVEYLNIDQVIVAIKQNFGDKSLNELLIQESNLIRKKSKLLTNANIRRSLDKIKINTDKIIREPKFPYPTGPREYQIEAYKSWVENGKKGIFAMATGTGKTITSLNCLLEIYKEAKSYKAIILVPTTALLEQWKKECQKFNYKNIITVSSKDNWNDNLSFYNTFSKFSNTSFIVIVTYASFVRQKFQSHFKLLPDNTLLIADETHNMGSPTVLNLLPSIHLNNRIGLSATPNRKYDIEGNLAIEDFFTDKYPYTFSYSMKQALDIGWLCKYTYFPHIVYLTEDELIDYINRSKQLLKYFDPVSGKYKDCKEVEILLLERKRIIHKAFNKKDAFRNILNAEFNKRGNLKYTLVYVPEGKDPNFTVTDSSIEDDEDLLLIDEYTSIVKETDETILVKQFTSKTKKRNEVLEEFENSSIHVLTSMKCLDEGVDVPRSELAIFCASTGNPRQFIQRRGRVLRNHPDKIHAVIHDLVVVPLIDSSEKNYEMERNLLKKELERVVDFSELSINKIDTYEELKEVLDYYNLNLNDFIIN